MAKPRGITNLNLGNNHLFHHAVGLLNNSVLLGTEKAVEDGRSLCADSRSCQICTVEGSREEMRRSKDDPSAFVQLRAYDASMSGCQSEEAMPTLIEYYL